MPYVNDKSLSSRQPLTIASSNASTQTFQVSVGRERSQFGFRSSPQEATTPEPSQYGKYAKKRATVYDVDDMGSYFVSGWSSRTQHDRRYSELDIPAPSKGRFSLAYRTKSGEVITQWSDAALQATSVAFTGSDMPHKEQLKLGESLRRQTAPDKPQFDLVRTLAEARDLPRIGTAISNLISTPASLRNLGDAYITNAFGFQPTASDIAYLADAALNLSRHTTRYVNQERQRIHRRRTHVIHEASDSGTQVIMPQSMPDHYRTRNVMFDIWGGLMRSTGGRCVVSTSYRMLTTLTAYASYEKVIVRNGSTDKQSAFRKRIRTILGEGLTAGTIYDLTPYSWLFDWFYDLGGVIRYQEAINSANVVDTGGGITYNRSAVGSVSMTGPDTYTYPRYPVGRVSLSSQISRLESVRTPGGSPYSLSSGWDSLSSSQAAVLAALGISRQSL